MVTAERPANSEECPSVEIFRVTVEDDLVVLHV